MLSRVSKSKLLVENENVNFLSTLSVNYEVRILKVIDFNQHGKVDIMFIDEDNNLKILVQDSDDE